MANLDYSLLPERLRDGMRRYIEHGIQPGHFLTAVICNDLREAVGRADDEMKPLLPEIVRWFHWEAPYKSWGSLATMLTWMEMQRNAGKWKEPEMEEGVIE